MLRTHDDAPSASPHRRVLVSTISTTAGVGGLTPMTAFIVRTLKSRGMTPVLVHYEPYGANPAFSVPAIHLLHRRPRVAERFTLGCETHAIGAWLPELEFMHNHPTAPWRRLMDSADAHVTVSGSVMPALPFQRTGRPFVAWVAAGWKDDRAAREKRYSPARKLLDAAIVTPVTRRVERAILRSGTILALSEDTRQVLNRNAGRPVVRDRLPQPIDADFFSPRPEQRVPLRIGFSGRLRDPRKNVGLLVEALGLLARRGSRVTALLVGGEPDPRIVRRVAELGLEDEVTFSPLLDPEALRDRLRTLDLYVVPSQQEGLCIAALEAMAIGIPVVSTRCGGPTEFVIDGETGRLVGFDPAEMADAIELIIGNPAERERLGANARDLVQRDYSETRAREIFLSAFDACFAGAPAPSVMGEVA